MPIVSDWKSEFKRLEGAYAPSTLKSYYADIEIFENWCLGNGLEPFPTTVSDVCQFLEDQAPGKAPSTVRRRLYAIRKSYCQIWCLRFAGHAAIWSGLVVSIPSLNVMPVMTLAR